MVAEVVHIAKAHIVCVLFKVTRFKKTSLERNIYMFMHLLDPRSVCHLVILCSCNFLPLCQNAGFHQINIMLL
jgi:hypothetical protein